MGLERIGERLERPTSLSKGDSLLGRPRSCVLTDPRCDVVESLLSLHKLGNRRRDRRNFELQLGRVTLKRSVRPAFFRTPAFGTQRWEISYPLLVDDGR